MSFPGLEQPRNAIATQVAVIRCAACRSQALQFQRVFMKEAVVARFPFQSGCGRFSEQPGKPPPLGLNQRIAETAFGAAQRSAALRDRKVRGTAGRTREAIGQRREAGHVMGCGFSGDNGFTDRRAGHYTIASKAMYGATAAPVPSPGLSSTAPNIASSPCRPR